MFDKLYALAEGKCIYEGPSNQLVPYLNDFNVKCPPYHNPADFCKLLLLELYFLCLICILSDGGGFERSQC